MKTMKSKEMFFDNPYEKERIEKELEEYLPEIAKESVKVRFLRDTIFIQFKSELGALRVFKAYSDLKRIDIKLIYNEEFEAWMLIVPSLAR
jgi:hypothetical protein